MNESRNGQFISIRIRKTWVYLGLGILIGGGAGFGVAMLGLRGGSTPEAARPIARRPIPPDSIMDVSVEGRPFQGPADAPVTLVEFTDYECPFCAQHFRETYPRLLSEYRGELKYVVRNYPVPELHPLAPKAAEAAECAGEQERFWDYHDILLERSPAIYLDTLKGYARELGLDTQSFDSCLDSGRKAAVVERDVEAGTEYGVTATPTFFINGRRIVGALGFDAFQAQIDAALEKAEAQAQ